MARRLRNEAGALGGRVALGVIKRRCAFRNPPVGDTLGYLTILGIGGAGRYHWRCRCRCGKEITAYYADVLSGAHRSCGCHHPATNLTHGQTRGGISREYRTWASMKTRCGNPATEGYRLYGGRGIRVCSAWQTFENFYADMGARPTPKHSIDRVDFHGHYSCGHCEECTENGWPANCRWATTREQTRNKSTNRWLTYGGETMVLNDWAARLGINRSTLVERLQRWPVEQALTRRRLNAGERLNDFR